jgi:hypothetical protein
VAAGENRTRPGGGRAVTLVNMVWLAGRSILDNKLRTLLTMLGVIIGVAAVLVMVALGEGARAQIRDRIENLGTNLIVVTPGAMRQAGVSQGAQTFNRLTLEDAEKLARESPYLAAVSPVVMTRTQVLGGGGNWRVSIYGVDASYRDIRDWDVASGRFFDAADVRTMRRVAVLGRAGRSSSATCRSRSSACSRPRARPPRAPTRTTSSSPPTPPSTTGSPGAASSARSWR